MTVESKDVSFDKKTLWVTCCIALMKDEVKDLIRISTQLRSIRFLSGMIGEHGAVLQVSKSQAIENL